MLSDGQLGALRNLSAKRAGAVVGWISISDARGLTDLGLAMRNRSGWQITDAGAAALEQVCEPPGPHDTVVRYAFKPANARPRH